MDNNRMDRLREILGELKLSQVLTGFFHAQRRAAENMPRVRPWSGEMEKLVIELLLSRARARMDRQFERSDAYRYILERLGLEVTALDAELKGPMREGEGVGESEGF